jgi:ribonuclease-3
MWDNQVYGVGKGTSKKRAEQDAARDALSKMVR